MKPRREPTPPRAVGTAADLRERLAERTLALYRAKADGDEQQAHHIAVAIQHLERELSDAEQLEQRLEAPKWVFADPTPPRPRTPEQLAEDARFEARLAAMEMHHIDDEPPERQSGPGWIVGR